MHSANIEGLILLVFLLISIFRVRFLLTTAGWLAARVAAIGAIRKNA